MEKTVQLSQDVTELQLLAEQAAVKALEAEANAVLAQEAAELAQGRNLKNVNQGINN